MKPQPWAFGCIALLCMVIAVTALAEPYQTTRSGMEFKDLKTGSGESADIGAVATLHFVGWLDNQGKTGKEIYNTHKENHPVSFVIGTDRVMPAWNDGVIGMRQGGKRILRVPPALGYGAKGVQDVVPPNSRMIFVIELVDLK